jgi:hypothetical protein
VILWEGDLSRVAATMSGLTVFAALQLVAVLRYGGAVEWHDLSAWIYVVFMLSLLLVGACGLWLNWSFAQPWRGSGGRVGATP